MNTRQVLTLGRAIHTQVTRNAVEAGPRSARVKELQKKFQIDDGQPVHVKAGLSDRLLYQFTTVLALVGVGMSFETLYTLTFGKK